MNYKIICDSACDVLSYGRENYTTVPMKIVAGERQFIDNSELDVSEMMTFLEKYNGKSGSSCPNVQEWLDAFGDAENVFCVAMTSNLSGSCNSARMAVKQYIEAHPDRHATVFDSLSTGPENALIAEKIFELADSGASFDEICTKVEKYQKSTHLIFALESMHNLAANGRVSHVVAKIAGILGIRAIGIASDVGTLEMVAKPRGIKSTISEIFKIMQEKGFCGGRVKIHHSENDEGAKSLAEKIRSVFPNCLINIRRTTALCSFYAERGGILVGYEG